MSKGTQLVDVMKVPVDGDPGVAVVDTAETRSRGTVIACDLLIAGGGTGGVAAAIAAAKYGIKVCLTEETDWLGGQFSAQGVSALDEHDHIEIFGGTASYYELRDQIRRHYRRLAGRDTEAGEFNPGRCWVSRLAFEPKIAADAVEDMLSSAGRTGNVSQFFRTKCFAATRDGSRIKSVSCLHLDSGETTTFEPRMVIDATELGDLLVLAKIEHVCGAESIDETGEPGAQPQGRKEACVQSYTYTFAMELGPAGDINTIPEPHQYDHNRRRQPYSLDIEVHGGEIYAEESGLLRYSIFEKMPGTKGSLWTYRRLIDAAQFPLVRRDISLLNWPGNDYRDGNLLTSDPLAAATALQQAKLVGLGFLFWLQTAAPTGDGRLGAPELRLRRDVMDTADGLSKFPYIRESRRIRALRTVTEEDVSAKYNHGLRAAHFSDSVGIGWYPIDIHRSSPDEIGTSTRTKPFQIPLGALLPRGVSNLVAGCKNIGTTHITNGCYRLHPVEWNVGEVAGHLCGHAMTQGQSPREIHDDPIKLHRFQHVLLAAGVPIAWRTDTGVSHPRFAAAQLEYMEKPTDFLDRL